MATSHCKSMRKLCILDAFQIHLQLSASQFMAKLWMGDGRPSPSVTLLKSKKRSKELLMCPLCILHRQYITLTKVVPRTPGVPSRVCYQTTKPICFSHSDYILTTFWLHYGYILMTTFWLHSEYFWYIILDDHWSKKIDRPKMIAWSGAIIHP